MGIDRRPISDSISGLKRISALFPGHVFVCLDLSEVSQLGPNDTCTSRLGVLPYKYGVWQRRLGDRFRLHACSMMEQSDSAWDGFPGATRRGGGLKHLCENVVRPRAWGPVAPEPSSRDILI